MHGSQEVDSPIPRVLLRSPRIIHRKPGTLGPLLLGRVLSAPILAAAIGLLALVVLEPIAVFVIPAQPARIVGRWLDAKARGGAAYYIQYRFDRSGFIGRDEVLPVEYNAFHLGQSVKAHVIHLGQIGYSALDRSLGSYARDRMIAWFSTLFAVAIGSVLFYAIWFLPWQSHWLARYGKATFGAVVAKGIVRSGRRQMSFTLTYQFKADGTLRAKRISIHPQRYDSADVKDLVIVLFDPARPGRSIIYDYCNFVAV